jgi:protoporphyrinogen oxidase
MAGVMAEPHVVILGGGPAGVGGAFYLRRRRRAAVTVIEQRDVAGGNAASFEIDGLAVDYGSHRLHHACDPAILDDIRSVLGSDLLEVPRLGRIRMRGRWLRFPLKPLDLMLRLDPAFAFGATTDMAVRALPVKRNEGDTFASVLRAKLGPAICDGFYFPYARKIWGREPEMLSGIQARRRVSASSFGKLLRKVFRPRAKSGFFYYPKHGYGQISSGLAAAAAKDGADMMFGWRVTRLQPPADSATQWRVIVERNGETRTIAADHVWSTIPTPLAARMMEPAVPQHVLDASGGISYRAMVLVYLVLDVDQFSTTDAHYFPEPDIRSTRIAEPKNYRRATEPKGMTVLCAEVPCDADDELWRMTDEQLGDVVADDLARAGIPLSRPPIRVLTRRLRQAYPIYLNGYEVPFGVLDEWASSVPRFLIYGRQGLFAHDNTHHALYMASAAVDCLQGGEFDHDRWARYREEFATHVVED